MNTIKNTSTDSTYMEEKIRTNLNDFRPWTKQDPSITEAHQLIEDYEKKTRSDKLPESKIVRESLEKIASEGKNIKTVTPDLINELIKKLEASEEKEAQGVKVAKGLLGRANYLAQEAFIDPTLGCLSKNAFDTAMKNVVAAKQKPENERTKLEKALTDKTSTVVLIDINNLKLFNDFGYDGCGNKAIEYAMDYVANNLRHSKTSKEPSDIKKEKSEANHHQPLGDLVTRLGGDEFIVMMPNCSKEQAEKRIRPILNEMAHESLGQTNPANNDFVKHRLGACEVKDDHGNKANVQISAAFGCAELPNSIAADVSPISIIKNTVTQASNEESKQKLQSKIEASEVAGGYPAFKDRDDAVKAIKKILIKQGLVPNVKEEQQETSAKDKIKEIGTEKGRRLQAVDRYPLARKPFSHKITENRASAAESQQR
jgi:GGDEF domain-containing protein